jgi:hypothetical protein
MADRPEPLLAVREKCPVCTATSSEVLYESPYDAPPVSTYLEGNYGNAYDASALAGASYTLRRCTECGLLYQHLIPQGSLLHDLYDKWIPGTERKRLAALYTLSDYRDWAGQVEFMIRQLGLQPADIHVLDFGLGWAEWASLARSYGCKVMGTEISPERIAYASSIGITMLTLEEISLHKFHFINTEQVFEHLTDPCDTLVRLARSLQTGGLLKISVPNGRGIRGRIRRDGDAVFNSPEHIMPIAPLEHINCYDYRALVRLGRQAGLTPVRPSLLHLYNSSSTWLEPREAARNILRPLYRHWFPKSTYVLFTHAA